MYQRDYLAEIVGIFVGWVTGVNPIDYLDSQPNHAKRPTDGRHHYQKGPQIAIAIAVVAAVAIILVFMFMLGSLREPLDPTP